MVCIWIYALLISHFSVIYIICLRAENGTKNYPLSLIVSSHPTPTSTYVFLSQADHCWTALMVEYDSLYISEACPILSPTVFFLPSVITQLVKFFLPVILSGVWGHYQFPALIFPLGKCFPIPCFPDNSGDFI